MTANDMIKTLPDEQIKKLIAHFNQLYECTELGMDEIIMIYLAWLTWKGYIKAEKGKFLHDLDELEFDEDAYDIHFKKESEDFVAYTTLFLMCGLENVVDILKG